MTAAEGTYRVERASSGWEVQWRKRGRVIHVASVTSPCGETTTYEREPALGEVFDLLPSRLGWALLAYTGVG